MSTAEVQRFPDCYAPPNGAILAAHVFTAETSQGMLKGLISPAKAMDGFDSLFR